MADTEQSEQQEKAGEPGKVGTTQRETSRTAPDVAPQNAPAEPRVVRVAEPAVSRPDLRKKELMDQVLERTAVKKRDAKPVIEAMLAVLGEALSAGRGLNLEPMGKLRINRIEEKESRRIVICKLRQGLETAGAGEGAGSEDTGEDPDRDGGAEHP